MTLFKIGENDYTNHITVPSYKVNSVDVYSSWTDAGYTEHREIVGTKLSGTFKMRFDNPDEFDSFFRTIRNNKTKNGSVLSTLYAVNMNEVFSAEVFIDIEAADTKPRFYSGTYDDFEVSITERGIH